MNGSRDPIRDQAGLRDKAGLQLIDIIIPYGAGKIDLKRNEERDRDYCIGKQDPSEQDMFHSFIVYSLNK